MHLPARRADTSTTTGTGALTLAGAAPTGYADLVVVGVAIEYATHYAIVAVDGSGVPTGQWESGVGRSDGSVLYRDNPKEGSSGDLTLVNFSAGTKQVFITPTSEFFEQATLGFQYAMARGFALP